MIGGYEMKKVLVLLAQGFEEIEAVAVIDILRRAGVIVQICSTGKEDVTGNHGITLKSDVRLDYIDIYSDTYDLIYLPGGQPGATNLKNDQRVIDLLKKYDEDQVLLAAICAAPTVLEEAGLLNEREGTSFPTYKDVLHFKEYMEVPFVKSKNILTSRGAGTAMEMGFKILEELGLKKEALELRETMQYNFMLSFDKN